MKKYLFLLLACTSAAIANMPQEKLIFSERTYFSKSYYDIASSNGTHSCVDWNLWNSSNYQLFENDILQAYGISDVLSFGFIFPSLRHMHFYNAQGSWIGKIDGRLAFSTGPYYDIYNEQGLCAIGVMDYSGRDFSIFAINGNSYNPHKIYARFWRQAEITGPDNWYAEIYEQCPIDNRVLRILGAFFIGYRNTEKENEKNREKQEDREWKRRIEKQLELNRTPDIHDFR